MSAESILVRVSSIAIKVANDAEVASLRDQKNAKRPNNDNGRIILLNAQLIYWGETGDFNGRTIR